MEEPSEIETWKRISILGSGAFGVVSLWQNKITDDYIAIKKCKFRIDGQITDKQKKRWDNEVNIMKTLNCPNIVSFKPLPKHLEAVLLKHNPTRLPLLSMEYCKKGNLRHVLNQVQNSSGLSEDEIRVVLKDIATAVAYLHKFNITHRDIKPENIVLQQCDVRKGGIIYKLIDLGYAKELNDSIVSFVGTLHYLAPEIIKTENYNYSVDYWSLGIVTFEVICGVLPFLPQYTPFERFPYIEKKKPEHICIYQLHSGSIANSSELLKENHVSKCLQQNIEIWLRHVLQYNPALRMVNFPGNISVFDQLINILNKKILNVFSIYTLEFYSYEINESILIGTLKDWIFRDTKVQKGDQVLLSNLKMFDVTDENYVIDILSEHDFNLFVFKKGCFISRETFTLPKYVKVLFENCTANYRWRELRLIYTKSLFFLSQEQKIITALLTSFELYNAYIYSLNVKLKSKMHQIHKDISTLIVRTDCYYNLHSNNVHIDMDNGDDYKQCLLYFKKLIANLEKCIFCANKLLTKIDHLSKRQVVLDKVLPKVTPIISQCDINPEIARAVDLLIKCGNIGQNQDLSCMEMVKIVSKSLKEKDKLLNNKNFQNYAKATSVAVKDAEALLVWMEEFHLYVKGLTKAIDANQRAQYRILLSSVKPKSKVSLVNGYSSDFGYLDADTVISENQELRCQFEEALGQMFLDYKNYCAEIDIYLSERF